MTKPTLHEMSQPQAQFLVDELIKARDVWQARAESAEKALAEMDVHFKAAQKGWTETIAERDELRAKLEEMVPLTQKAQGQAIEALGQRDELRALHQRVCAYRDELMAERDDLRAKLEEARAVVGRVATERDDWCRTNEANLAKLAAAEDWKRSRGVLLGDEPKNYQELKAELAAAEAKLAAAEARYAECHDVNIRHEARVTALEESLRLHTKEWEQLGQYVTENENHGARVAELGRALRKLLAEADGGADYAQSGPDTPGQAHARRCLEGK